MSRNQILFLIAFPLVIFSAANTWKSPHSGAPNDLIATTVDSIAKGKKLALIHCQRCHLFTEPALLDKKTWVSSVLPNMGLRLGIKSKSVQNTTSLNPEEAKTLQEWNIYPDQPLLSLKDWNLIVKYFEHESPSQLPLPASNPPQQLSSFLGQYISFGAHQFPQTTMIKYDARSGHFFIGDAHNDLYLMNTHFQLVNQSQIKSPAVDMDFPRNKAPRLLSIGSIVPSDQKRGELIALDGDPNGLKLGPLARPVQFAAGDLNCDGKEDLVVCSFGNHRGQLAWYDQGNPSKEHILSTLPGTRQVEIRDMNGDQKNDLVVLRAQAYEAVSIYYNQDQGRFEEKVVLQFPPVYGLSYLEMADFNQDGFLDLLVTNGDNWDLSAILKPYHGIRIFLNDGKNQFAEKFFYPLYGTSKALARDFDLDGDLDIAAIAFYTNLEQPEHGFVYLQNEGKLSFTAAATPDAAAGKWLCMEAGDFDRDGDQDIILGSYFHTAAEVAQLAVHSLSSFPQLLVLYNQKN